MLIAAEPQFRRRNLNQGKKGNDAAKLAAAVAGLILLALLKACTVRHRSYTAVGSQPPSSAYPSSPVTQPYFQARSSRNADPYEPHRSSQGAAPAFTETTPEVSRLISAAERAQREGATRRYLEGIPEVTHYRYLPLDQRK